MRNSCEIWREFNPDGRNYSARATFARRSFIAHVVWSVGRPDGRVGNRLVQLLPSSPCARAFLTPRSILLAPIYCTAAPVFHFLRSPLYSPLFFPVTLFVTPHELLGEISANLCLTFFLRELR